MKMNNIAIIGAGASGMMAAISAARSGANVTLFEANDRVGKKILVTGNGRCNLSNVDMNAKYYYSDDLRFVTKTLERFSTDETVQFFKSIGVLSKEKNGGLYPVTESAATVLDALRFSLERYQIKVCCDHSVNKIKKINQQFKIDEYEELFDRVIVSTGLFAGKNTKQAKYGMNFANELKLQVKKPLPSLVQLYCKGEYFKQLAGVRTTAKISAHANDELIKSDLGELQLTNYGLSGIPTFQLSSEVSRALEEKKNVSIRIDFLPWIENEEILSFIKNRKVLMPEASFEEFTNGILHKKIIMVAIKTKNLKLDQKISSCAEKKIIALFNLLKNWEIEVIKTNTFEHAQVCTGGILTSELTPFFELKKMNHVYVIGELINVDGMCGGYNLQWAWSSGAIAGSHAALS